MRQGCRRFGVRSARGSPGCPKRYASRKSLDSPHNVVARRHGAPFRARVPGDAALTDRSRAPLSELWEFPATTRARTLEPPAARRLRPS